MVEKAFLRDVWLFRGDMSWETRMVRCPIILHCLTPCQWKEVEWSFWECLTQPLKQSYQNLPEDQSYIDTDDIYIYTKFTDPLTSIIFTKKWVTSHPSKGWNDFTSTQPNPTQPVGASVPKRPTDVLKSPMSFNALGSEPRRVRWQRVGWHHPWREAKGMDARKRGRDGKERA